MNERAEGNAFFKNRNSKLFRTSCSLTFFYRRFSESFNNDEECFFQAVPVAPGPSILHSGRIQQLSGKGLLQSGSWKKRYCVLDGQRLFFYQQDSSSDPSKEKTGHYIDLRCYDICEEAAGSIIKDVQRSRSGSSSSVTGSSKEQHVWVISSADIEKGSHRFFETVCILILLMDLFQGSILFCITY